MARDDLKELYGVITERHGHGGGGKRRDITSSTSDLLSKSHPKSPMVLDFEAELFGLSPEEIKRLPIKSVEMLLQALQHLISKTKEDPILRQALRKMINAKFNQSEEEDEEPLPDGSDLEPEEPSEMPEGKMTDATILEAYKHFLQQLSEVKAQKFNYKVLLDIEPTKINNPIFNQLLQSFQLVDLTRPQKQGVLLLLKKLAEIAESNPQIGQALNRIVRMESAQEAPLEGEFRESLTQEQEDLIMEGVFDTTMTPQTLLVDLGINKFKADDFASTLLGYADWKEVAALPPEKFAGAVKQSIKTNGGLQKFIELLVKAKLTNSRPEKLVKLLTAKI